MIEGVLECGCVYVCHCSTAALSVVKQCLHFQTLHIAPHGREKKHLRRCRRVLISDNAILHTIINVKYQSMGERTKEILPHALSPDSDS